MVRRVMNMVYKEVRGLHQAAYVLGIFAFGSQVLALVRDRMLAHQFGAGSELDLYYAAFRIPDLLYVIFASTLSVYVLIPFVAARMHSGDGKTASVLLGQMLSVFLVGYSLLALAIWCALPYLVPVLFPGLVSESDTLVTITRILLLQPLLLGMSSLFGVVTQLTHRFILYALSPLMYNIGIIFGIGVLYPLYGLSGLVYGVVVGALAHLVVQVPLVMGSALAFRPQRTIDWVALKSVLMVSVPRAAALSMHQVELLVFVSIASMMTAGSVAIFQFAYNLQSVPLAIIGASYSTAAFPLMADMFAQKRLDDFRLHVTTALRHIIFWSVPIIGLVVVLRAQMVRVVLGSGAFDWSDTRLTAAVLALFTLSLFAQAMNLLLVRAFYASGVTRIPFFVTLFGSFFSITSALVLYSLYITHSGVAHTIETWLRVSEVSGSEVLVLGVGYSMGVLLQSIVFTVLFVRMFSVPMGWVVPHFARSLFAACVGGTAAYVTINFIVEGLNTDTFLGIFFQGLFGGIAGVLGVVAAYRIVRSPELQEISHSLHRRILRTRVIASDDSVL